MNREPTAEEREKIVGTIAAGDRIGVGFFGEVFVQL
jgi:hypothetical protein